MEISNFDQIIYFIFIIIFTIYTAGIMSKCGDIKLSMDETIVNLYDS